MAENEDGQEKSEEPSQKKLQDAKKKGEVPRSKELNSTLVLLASSFGLMTMGADIGEGLSEMIRSSLQIDRSIMFDPVLITKASFAVFIDALILLLPFMLLLIIVVLVSPALLGGFAISAKKMKPKLSNMSPLKGAKKLFGTQGLMELVKAILKVSLIAGVGTILILNLLDDVLRFGRYEFAYAFTESASLISWFFVVVSSTVIVIALIDVPFQIWQYKKQQRMTKKEVKDEHKNTEGSPEVKGRIRELQMQAAMRRMMEDIPKADVIITNPTHFAVALQYNESMSAPKLVAKGSDLIAARIREIAGEHNIPIVEAPPLARAIYYSAEIDSEIPARLYLAVAQILAYIYQLKEAAKHNMVKPEMPTDLDVPDDMWKGK